MLLFLEVLYLSRTTPLQAAYFCKAYPLPVIQVTVDLRRALPLFSGNLADLSQYQELSGAQVGAKVQKAAGVVLAAAAALQLSLAGKHLRPALLSSCQRVLVSL